MSGGAGLPDPVAGLKRGTIVRLVAHALFPGRIGEEWDVAANGRTLLVLRRNAAHHVIPKRKIDADASGRFHTRGRYSNDPIAIYEVVHGT
jgi:hypothetical protein